MTTKYTLHKSAEAYPEMLPHEYEALRQSIAEHGQYDPILITPDNEVIDGRHRLKACIELGVEPKATKVVGTNDQFAVIAKIKNEIRRSSTLTTAERDRAIVETWAEDETISNRVMAQMFGCAHETVREAKNRMGIESSATKGKDGKTQHRNVTLHANLQALVDTPTSKNATDKMGAYARKIQSNTNSGPLLPLIEAEGYRTDCYSKFASSNMFDFRLLVPHISIAFAQMVKFDVTEKKAMKDFCSKLDRVEEIYGATDGTDVSADFQTAKAIWARKAGGAALEEVRPKTIVEKMAEKTGIIWYGVDIDEKFGNGMDFYEKHAFAQVLKDLLKEIYPAGIPVDKVGNIGTTLMIISGHINQYTTSGAGGEVWREMGKAMRANKEDKDKTSIRHVDHTKRKKSA